MRSNWLDLLALAALVLAVGAAAPPAGRADETSAEAAGEVSVPAAVPVCRTPKAINPAGACERVRGAWRPLDGFWHDACKLTSNRS
jgi:hypothetical protein